MICLIPVSRFRITYEVAAGRPFSRLERMILRAIQQGKSDLDGLGEIFQVHPRLLIEGLVTLTQAGWLAVGSAGAGGFVLTSEGRDAAGSDRPPSTTAVSSRRAFVVMERLTGGLIPNDEVRFVSKRDLDSVWEQSLKLSTEVSDNRLDEGQVQHLLPLSQGEWVRWIGPIDMMSKDAHWLPVNVDLHEGVVVGLPEAWLPRLRATINDEARGFAANLGEEVRARTWSLGAPRRLRMAPDEASDRDVVRVLPVGWPVVISEGDFCFRGDGHEQLIVGALENARSSVLVASAFANITKLEALRPHIDAALKRGLSIDLMWGYMADGSTDGLETVEWLRKLAYGAKRDGLKGVIRFNQLASGSHAKLLLWDEGPGFRAWVGSYNWLSATPGDRGKDQPRNVSVRISAPAVVGALARCAAAMWSGAESEVLTSTSDRWRRIAADLDMMASRSESVAANATVRLVLDREHEVLLREWIGTAQIRLLVASHRLGPAGENRLVSAEIERPSGFAFEVLFGQAVQDELGLARIADLVRRCGGDLKHVPALHAKLVVSDASACVSSYNFLSADPFGTAKNARELGIVIDGAEPVEWLWTRFRKGQSDVGNTTDIRLSGDVPPTSTN